MPRSPAMMPLNGSPNRASLAARARPTRSASRCSPPANGMLPERISTAKNVASSAATRKSQARASSNPPPIAPPRTTATVGMRNASMAWNELLHSAMNVRNQSALFPGHSGTLPPHAEIRAVRPNDEHAAVAQARVMDCRAKVHGELAADAVRRGVRQDNGPDAVILLKSDRHLSHSSVRSGFRRRERASAVEKWGTSTAL